MEVNVPTQVARQAAEVERLVQEMEAAKAPLTQPQAEPPAEPPVPPAPVVQTPVVPATPQAQTPQAEDSVWKQRFLSLQGKFNAEVPRLHDQIRDLTTQLNTAVSKMEALSKPQPDAKPAKSLVTDKDVETYGSDLIDLVHRKAQEVVMAREQEMSASVEKLKTENEELRRQLTGVSERQGQSDQQIYFGELVKLVPDFEQLNSDPEFLMWLSEVDPMSGFPRQAYLDNAFQNRDARRTAVLFNAFKQIKAPVVPPAPPVAPQSNPEVQRQVAPGKSKNSTTPASTNASDKIWTADEIDRFFRDVGRGAYRENPADQARIEADIDLALIQGRVRG